MSNGLLESCSSFVFCCRCFAEMETQREKSATPTRNHVTASSLAVEADDDDG